MQADQTPEIRTGGRLEKLFMLPSKLRGGSQLSSLCPLDVGSCVYLYRQQGLVHPSGPMSYRCHHAAAESEALGPGF